jgi:Uri superfamily endonuclease
MNMGIVRPSDVHMAPEAPGTYQLYIRLSQPARITVGRLGIFDFSDGLYIYTGSALNGLRQRLVRHCRADKTLHWHIDYLLYHAAIEFIALYPTKERLECELNQQTLGRPGASVPMQGFGSSDCRCISHLVAV